MFNYIVQIPAVKRLNAILQLHSNLSAGAQRPGARGRVPALAAPQYEMAAGQLLPADLGGNLSTMELQYVGTISKPVFAHIIQDDPV